MKTLYGELDRDSGVRLSLCIEFDANSNSVTGVYVTTNNGFSMSAGITVEINASIIMRLYSTQFKNDNSMV